jgi:hypothetical protein
MVGGIVIGLSRRNGETLLNVQDTRRANDLCAVRCEERRTDTNEPVSIAVGDSVWWQCGNVYWTPAASKSGDLAQRTNGRANWDIPLPKIGYSH